MKHSSKHGNTARADVAFFPTIPFSKHQMIALGLIVFILLTLFQRAYRSNSTEAPHPMPPHPSLRERIQRGEVKLPIYMTNPAVARTKGIDSAAGPRTPRIGAIQTLAVVVDFSDKVRTVTASFFDSLIFAAPVAGRGSVYDYFDEISYGQVDIVTLNLPSSLGWQRAPSSYAYYTGGGYCTDAPYPNNCQKLAEDIVDAINGAVNFANYDNDGDGYTESILLIHAGRGAELSGSTNDIWSHAWGLNVPRNYDGKTISQYVIMPEYWFSVSAAASDMTIGVFAHEMGHGFWNLPDLYDRDSSSFGISDWSLMASGSWNGPGWNGASPAWPDAWSRVQMGFTTPTAITGSLTGLNIPQAYNNPAPAATVFSLRSLALEDQEYYLLENRQKASGSYDEYLPGAGLLIWHIDEAMNVYTKQNDYECETSPHYTCSDTYHYLVALEQADGQLELEKKADLADAGDPFPGSTLKTSWTTATNPESSSWYGSTQLDSCIGVTNISSSGSNMTANVQTCGAPTNLAANAVSQTQINLSWTDTTTTESGFRIERSPNGATGWTEVGTAAANSTTYANTGLACGTTYYYRVKSYARSDSPASSVASATTTMCAPAAPGGLTATPVSQTQINLAWTDNSSTEAGFKIERSLTGTSGWSEVGSVGANVTGFSNTSLTCGTTYYYRVYAYNVGGNSAYSNTASATTVACPPSAPGGLAATPVSQTQINLAWADNSSNESGFKIERSIEGAGAWVEIGATGPNGTSYASSSLASAATTACPPGAPTHLAAAPASQTSISLTWTDRSEDESGFKIERSLNGIDDWEEIATVEAGANSYTDTGLSRGTLYYYRVRAFTAEGSSAYSNIASTSTLSSYTIFLPVIVRSH